MVNSNQSVIKTKRKDIRQNNSKEKKNQMSYEYGDSFINSQGQMRSFERLSHANSNQDWDGYSFTEKIDPEDQGYVNPQLAAGRAGWILPLSILAALVSLGLIVVTWVQHRRCPKLWTFISIFLAFLAFFISIAAAYYSGNIKNSILTGRRENSTLSGLVYIFSALFVPAFFALGIYWILNKPFRYGCIQCGYPGQGQAWTGYKDNYSLEQGWQSDKTWSNWAAALSFILAALFLLITLTVATLSKYLIEINRGLLAAAGFLVVLFALVNIYRNYQASATNAKIENSQLGDTSYGLQRWLLRIAIGLAILTLIFNVLKKRILYFLFGVLLLILAVVLIGNTASQMRTLRQVNDPTKVSNLDCSLNLARIHENDIKEFCPAGKYLPKGQVCRKVDDTIYWEGDGSKRALNPSACAAASSSIYYKTFLSGFNTFLVFGYLLIMACCAFFLSDTTEFMEIYNKKIGMLEIIFLGLALLITIIAIFLIPKIQKPNVFEENDWAEKNRLARQGIDPNDPDFVIVDDGVFKKFNAPAVEGSKTFNYNKAKIPTLQCNEATETCTFRVAILANKATILNKPTNGKVSGTQMSRYIFYPDCKSADADYLFLRGSADDINAAIQLLEYKPTGFEKSTIYYQFERVDKNKIDVQGLLPGESTSTYQNPTANGVCPAPAGFTPYAGTPCNSGSCKFSTELNAFSKTVPVVGAIKVLNNDGSGTSQFPDKNDLEVKVLRNGADVDGTNVIIGNDCVVGFHAPVNDLGDYTLQVLIRDKKGRYLPNTVDLSVPSSPPPQLSIGYNVLILPGGSGCGGLSADMAERCYSENKLQRFGDLTLHVIDADTDQPVEGALVKLFHLHTTKGTQFGQDDTNSQGNAHFDHVKYDYMNAQIEKEGYYPHYDKIFLNIKNLTQTTYLFKHDTNKANLRMNSNNPNVETDVMLDIKSKTGKTCTVSPANKYCAYAVHKKDVNKGQVGYESIVVEKFTVSKYLFYTMRDETEYNANCPAAQTSTLNYHAATVEEFSWDEMKKRAKHMATIPKYWAVKCFTGFGAVSDKYVGKSSDTKPNISELCDPLYPAGSDYGLERLEIENNAMKAQNNLKK